MKATSIAINAEQRFQSQLRDTASVSYVEFLAGFPLQDDKLYQFLFDKHSAVIQTQKARFAVANLQKIFAATFRISAVSGFDRMSLRDLSRDTGMSMGAIYSCISKKEDIALMVADVVRESSELTRQHMQGVDSSLARIQRSIRFHLFASTLLQPWYFFLYFETRSLPEQQQIDSKQIELDGIDGFTKLIEAGIENGEFKHCNARVVANMIVVLLEDWYLKPWKNQPSRKLAEDPLEQGRQIDNYNQSINELVHTLLVTKSS